MRREKPYPHCSFMGNLALLVLFALVQSLEGEELYLTRSPLSTIDSIIFLQRPIDFQDGDYLYREFVQPLDDTIQTTYFDRWRYHETQILFASTSWKYEHLSVGSMDFYEHAPYEGDVRHEFASQVLRIRMDAALRSYLSHPERVQDFKRAHRALDGMKNVSLITSEGEQGAEFKMGYDVFSDSSKLEYVSQSMEAGLYYSRFLNSLMEFGRKLGLISVRLRTRLGAGLPIASVGYSLSGDSIEAGVSKSFSTTIETQLISVQPLRDSAPLSQTYEMRIIYRF